MSKAALTSVLVLVGLTFFVVLYVFVPQRVIALGGAANAMCKPWNAACPCGAGINPPKCDKGGPNTANCPPGICKDKTNNLTTIGICAGLLKCEGVSGQGAGGIGDQAINQLLGQAMQQIMGALQGGGGGGGGGGTDFGSTTGLAGCTNYYQVSTPSTDPCAIYSPSAVLDAGGSGSSGIANDLLGALGSPSPSNVSGGILDTIRNVTGGSNTQTGGQPQAPTPGNQGLSGDLRVGNAGATIFANLREGLSEVAGFFGGSTGGASQALSAAGRLCSTRPWQGGFVSNVISPAFFDGICRLSGYQVGVIAPTRSGQTGTTSSGSNTGGTAPRPFVPGTVSNVPPEADIWAEPSSVRLGTRTYIFWRAQGVVSCAATGPNFSQNSLSGGASTVPISGPTTFSIECLTGASTTIRDSVTVQIAI